jgi:hypothetical protein
MNYNEEAVQASAVSWQRSFFRLSMGGCWFHPEDGGDIPPKLKALSELDRIK